MLSLARNIVNGLLDFFGALCNSLSLYVVGACRQYSDVSRRDMPDAGVDFAGGAVRENTATCIKTFPVDKRCHSPDNGAANNGDSNVLTIVSCLIYFAGYKNSFLNIEFSITIYFMPLSVLDVMSTCRWLCRRCESNVIHPLKVHVRTNRYNSSQQYRGTLI